MIIQNGVGITSLLNGNTVKEALNAANELVNRGIYDPTTLSAVDPDLAVGNIKLAEVIFGFVGTAEGAVEATPAMFRALLAFNLNSVNPTAPDHLNDNDVGAAISFDAVNEYIIVAFSNLVKIKRWRQYGDNANNGDGRWKIQYWRLDTQAWADWITNVPVRTTQDWSTLATETEKTTVAIKLICTTRDSAGQNKITELEVIF